MKAPQDSFLRFVLLSLGFHAIILTVLTVKILFFPSVAPEYKQAVRIDVVALPEKQTDVPKIQPVKKPEPVKKDPPKPKPKPKKPKPKKPKPKPKPKKPTPKKPKPLVKKPKPKKPDTKKVQDEQDSALARLKALQKMKEKENEDNDPVKKIEYKGNQISKGNSLTGMAKLHHENYTNQLEGHIRSYWNLPEWLANGNLRAVIILRINSSGGIIGKEFVSTSGNELFDQHVLGTLEKASPLPAPPSNLVDLYATKGVEMRFPE